MKIQRLLLSLPSSLLIIIHGASAKSKRVVGLGSDPLDGFMLKSEAPDTGEEWKSIHETLEFQISSDFDHEDEKMKNTLRLLLEGDQDSMPAKRRMDYDYSAYSDTAIFLDGQETYYEAYSQAWRYMGFYVDCNPSSYGDRRRLEDGSGTCQRYLLWAAYVDPNYQGNGLYEYQFYDRYGQNWTSYCEDEDVCRKMDCHEEDTEFKLIGFFKHADYFDWVEQLFKHEGVCIWTDDEYQFMKDEEDLFPEGCAASDYTDEDGNVMYYDFMPQANGDWGIGLYTDSKCSNLYGGDTVDVYDMYDQDRRRLGSGSGDQYPLNETVALYNEAFSIFKICQPCIAYDLDNYMECDDEAGYTNVNQCMKFSSKCERQTASLSDVSLAAAQKSTVSIKLMGQYITSSKSYSYSDTTIDLNEESKGAETFFFVASLALLGAGIFSVYQTRKTVKSNSSAFKEPLVSLGGTYA